jgi:tetratricopeptide (TPR) repeat protein
MKDFFVSYNKADRSWAEWIAWQLEEEGYTTIIQAWDFRPGSNFVLDMQEAASKAKRTIAVLSPEYLAAEFTQPEWAAAFAQDPTGKKATLLPVRVRKTKTKGLLRSIVYIDLVELNETAARAALLEGLPRKSRKPTTAPNFPGAPKRSVPNRPRFPGALPGIWNVPHQRNPNFTGREELLTDLRAALTSGQHAALTQAIHGLGGVGKTQLAVEYAYRYASEYDIVWWVRSEEPSTLAAEYAALATKLGLPEKDAREQAAIAQAVRHWLEQNFRWLLVFDNAANQNDLRNYLPRGATGHVLITSRDSNWRGVATTLSVKVLAQYESIDFLLKRTGQKDREAATKLAHELGNLPLALEQAGAYMEESGRSVSDYLELFQTRQREILKRGAPSTDYPDTVATTWELSFQEVQKASPAGADLLNLCAFLAPDDIPQGMLREGAEYLPKSLATAVADPLAFDDSIAPLRHYSLVEIDIDRDALSVHRLVQAVVRDRLGEEERKLWAEAVVRLANKAFPYGINDMSTWQMSTLMLPHALAASSHIDELGLASEIAGSLLNQVGLYLIEFAQYTQAKGVLERAVAINEIAYGADNPNLAAVVSNLGNVLQDLGDLAGAREHYERALAILEAAYGPNHPTVAIAVNNLGAVLRELGDMAGARAHLERALAIDEAAYGPSHPNVASRVSNLGAVLQELGDMAGARAHLERALVINEATYGPVHPAVGINISILGLIANSLGDLPEARSHLERALAIDEATYGPNHPAVAIRVWSLGAVLRDLGDLEMARIHIHRAFRIFNKYLGEDHPTTKKIRTWLGKLDEEIARGQQG